MTFGYLPASPYLKLCKKPLGDLRYKEITEYAAYAVKMLLPKETAAYGSLKLSIFDGIFLGNRSVSEITQKKYSSCSAEQTAQLMYCELLNLLCSGRSLFVYSFDEKRDYILTSPRKISARLTEGSKSSFIVQKRLSMTEKTRFFDKYLYRRTLSRQNELELKIGGALMVQAEKDLAFVTRFNEETYFKSTNPTQYAEKKLGIKEKSDVLAFTVLYSVSFFGLSYNEIFTVEDVFGFSDNGIRSKDGIKTNATLALKNDLQRCTDAQLGSMLEQMGQALCRIPLPKIFSNIGARLARSYVLYNAVSRTGEVFLKLTDSSIEPVQIYKKRYEDSFKAAEERARLLSEYNEAADMCGELKELPNSLGAVISDAKHYGSTLDLEKKVKEEEERIV